MPHSQRGSALLSERTRLSQMLADFDARWPDARRRAGGLALALLIEAALFLALLTLGVAGKRERTEALTTVEFAPEKQPEPAPDVPEKEAKASALPRAVPKPRPDQPTPPQPPIPLPPPPAAVLSPKEVPAPTTSRIKAVIRDDMQGPVGPPDTGHAGDSEQVGSRPNGEPIYAARWYREPTNEELRGYLSTASGPGWALINCRTVAGYRVEDCVLEGEYPAGAQIGRAVMAAAWQFKVRPPQVGGRVLVGEWVRIRITYELRAR
jgi:protein TonB